MDWMLRKSRCRTSCDQFSRDTNMVAGSANRERWFIYVRIQDGGFRKIFNSHQNEIYFQQWICFWEIFRLLSYQTSSVDVTWIIYTLINNYWFWFLSSLCGKLLSPVLSKFWPKCFENSRLLEYFLVRGYFNQRSRAGLIYTHDQSHVRLMKGNFLPTLLFKYHMNVQKFKVCDLDLRSVTVSI